MNGIMKDDAKSLIKYYTVLILLSTTLLPLVVSGCCTCKKDVVLSDPNCFPYVADDEWYKFKEYPKHILVPVRDLEEVLE